MHSEKDELFVVKIAPSLESHSPRDLLIKLLIAFIDKAAEKLACKSQGSDELRNIVKSVEEASIEINLEIARWRSPSARPC
jgi:hypothetical protein